MLAHGMPLTRSFFYWPDFMPTPDRLDENLCGHFLDFLDAHAERGMSSIPTFLVGHMSGQNWDPAVAQRSGPVRGRVVRGAAGLVRARADGRASPTTRRWSPGC